MKEIYYSRRTFNNDFLSYQIAYLIFYIRIAIGEENNSYVTRRL
jgi:hypothetical protein